MKNLVFIGRSLDGYIAGPNDELDWLDTIPNPEKLDMGYHEFMNGVDALVMGRKTFDVVRSFGGKWPYKKPVFVLSNSMKEVPEKYEDHVQLVSGDIHDVLNEIHKQGYHNLYIDGGKTIKNFLEEDLVDELTITTIPVIIGKGIPLFSEMMLPNLLEFEHVKSIVYLESIVQDQYRRKRG